MSDDEKLMTKQIAALLGVRRSTVVTYHHQAKRERAEGRDRWSLFPAPDGYHEPSGWPWWWRSTIVAWNEVRPGRGARTDLYDPDFVPTPPINKEET